MKEYFEGWYFKHQKDDKTICFIVGKSKDEAFVQVITNDFSKVFKYKLGEYKVCKSLMQIRIGNNIFSKDGCIVRLCESNMLIRGRLKYGRLTPLKYDIMGVFKYVPAMECRHGVVSMDHNISGELEINGERVSLTGGNGYIECDRGKSFPSSYLWCQCNTFETKTGIMIAVANIPILSFSFTGVIASVFHHGKEYRFATYLGARVEECNENCVVVSQGKYKLEAIFNKGKPHKLAAPNMGEMTRSIREQVSTPIQFKMYINGVPYFNLQSNNGCVEIVDKEEPLELAAPIEI